MPIYTCEKCARLFERKSGFDAHKAKKKDCSTTTSLLSLPTSLLSLPTHPTTNIVHMVPPPVEKTVAELIVACKTAGIKGYTGKKKEELRTMLENARASDSRTEPRTDSRTESRTESRTDPEPLRYADMFCGLGAFHTAFNSRNSINNINSRNNSRKFKCVIACDIDEGARRIYKANYGLEPHGDIRALDLDAMPDIDILCCGFPCQTFSIAGNGKGFEDTVKGNLFFDILKILDKKNPPMCILENVKNLKTHDKGNTYKTIVTELTNRGYLVTSKVINASEYGSPQARHRIFIIATRGKPFTIPESTGTFNTVRTILDPAITRDELNRAKYTVVEKDEKEVKPGKPHILYDLFPIPSEKKKAATVAKGEDDPKEGPKGGRQGERVYSVDAVGITVCASSGGPGAKTGLYKVGDAIRRLSVGETLKMFGFPETYAFPDTSPEECLFYLGNSIVVDVPKALVPAVEAWFIAATAAQ